MQQPSRQVTSNQLEVHENLERVVRRNWHSEFKKPVHSDSARQVEQLLASIKQPNIIIDAGCGTGQSTDLIAQRFPDAYVIGIDKSGHRLQRHQRSQDRHRANAATETKSENYCLLRSDLVDFWRLARSAGLKPARHYILYPNPWPKKHHLQRRWHGSAVFKDIVMLGGQLELRSNWRLYLEEFAHALEIVGQRANIEPLPIDEQPLSAFERKYRQSGQALWQLTTTLTTHGN